MRATNATDLKSVWPGRSNGTSVRTQDPRVLSKLPRRAVDFPAQIVHRVPSPGARVLRMREHDPALRDSFLVAEVGGPDVAILDFPSDPDLLEGLELDADALQDLVRYDRERGVGIVGERDGCPAVLAVGRNLDPHLGALRRGDPKSPRPRCAPPAAGKPISIIPASRRNSFTLAGPKPA